MRRSTGGDANTECNSYSDCNSDPEHYTYSHRDANRNSYCDTHAHSYSEFRRSSDAESDSRFDIHLFNSDLYVERRQRDQL